MPNGGFTNPVQLPRNNLVSKNAIRARAWIMPRLSAYIPRLLSCRVERAQIQPNAGGKFHDSTYITIEKCYSLK